VSSRVRAIVITIIVLFSATALMVTPSTTAGPMLDFSMDIAPEEVLVFPTYAQIGRMEFLGTVHCNKTRPDEIRVSIEGSVDVPWDFFIEPQMMVIRGVGERHLQFHVYLSVPPRTAGPPLVTMTLRAYADLAGRTEECTAQARLHIVQDVHGFIDSFPYKIVVPPDGGVDGTAFIENILDQELEVHMSASGDWESLIPDLDFQQDIVLQPYEQRPARFHGKLSSSVEPGSYPVEMILWTPGHEGDRSIITTVNVTLEVLGETGDNMGDALLRSAFPLFLVVCLALGSVTYWSLQRRGRSKGLGP